MQGDLIRLLVHSAAPVRDLAHALVMRHIRQDPGSSHSFVNAYLQCLNSNNQDIVNAALKNLPEFAILAQGLCAPTSAKSKIKVIYM